MDSLIFELQIVFYFQLFLSANVRHSWTKILLIVRKCSKCKKLSLERDLDDFSRRHCKANIRKFSRGVRTKIYDVFKVKNRKNFNRQVQIVTGPESKHLQLPEPIVGRYDELGRELEHFNWVLFSVLTICKSVYFKTETDKTCKVRINADSFYS